MNLLRDRRSRLFKPSSPVDPIAAIAIPLLLAVAAVLIVAILLVAGVVTAWLRSQPQAAAPLVHQLSERDR
jgi:hypothetical protein